MPDDWSPRFVPKQAPMPATVVGERGLEVVNIPRATKAEPPQPAVNIRGWRFVPERDANNLIVEIIATPIIE